MATEQIENIAGLTTTLVGSSDNASSVVILLHGYAMRAADLAPFTHALGGHSLFLLPQAPHATVIGGYGWWQVDSEARAAALQLGPRDLATEHPTGLPHAREQLKQFMVAVKKRFKPRCLIVGGFSQGGMLACDFLLHEGPQDIVGLFLLSSSRINIDAWTLRQTKLTGLPVLISHGRADDDLSFAAGEALRDFVQAAGAKTQWIEFDAGHQIPLPVWRELRRFIRMRESD